jgi:precorrin isomerase
MTNQKELREKVDDILHNSSNWYEAGYDRTLYMDYELVEDAIYALIDQECRERQEGRKEIAQEVKQRIATADQHLSHPLTAQQNTVREAREHLRELDKYCDRLLAEEGNHE